MKSQHLFIRLSLATLILVFWSKDFILFWDTVQFAGKHGLWYYEKGISSGLLPPHLDSGHPPFFGMYLAGLWKIFGCSPVASSFAMLPFLVLNIYFAIEIGKVRLQKQYWLYPIALISCPFYLGHSLLISPDLILVSGFLISWYGLLSYKRKFLILGSLLLCLISLRGAVVCAALVLYHGYYLYQISERPKIILRKLSSIYLPAILAFIGFQVIHYFQSSWIGFHEDSPWSTSFELVGVGQLWKNIAVFVWRLLDYGMIVPYGIIAYFFLLKKKRSSSFVLLVVLLFLFIPLLLPFSGLLNHRYFLPLHLVALLVALEFMAGQRLRFAAIMIALLFAGNFIIYPDRISQGWDSTAAHWPLYTLENEMFLFIEDSEKISTEKVGTAFPLRVARRFLDLVSPEDKGYHQYDLSEDDYILYSNIMNEYSDAELAELQTWNVVKKLQRRGIHLILYSRK